jgi:hypothetical protein
MWQYRISGGRGGGGVPPFKERPSADISVTGISRVAIIPKGRLSLTSWRLSLDSNYFCGCQFYIGWRIYALRLQPDLAGWTKKLGEDEGREERILSIVTFLRILRE